MPQQRFDHHFLPEPQCKLTMLTRAYNQLRKFQVMITKDAKAVLFASLLAAMILPFSMTDDVVAQEETDVKEKIRELIEQREPAAAASDSTESDDVLKRLKLAEKLLKVRDRLIHDPTNERLLERESNLLERLINSYGDLEMNEFGAVSGASAQTYYPTANYETSEQERYDCAEDRDETGNIEGTITLVTRQSSNISIVNNYPADSGVTDSSGEDCVSIDLTDINVGYRIISGLFTGCFDSFTSSELPRVVSCNNIGTDFSPHVVLVTTSAEYEGNVSYYPTEGWDIVYVG